MQMEVTNRLSMLWGCPEKKGLWLRLDLPQEGASRRVCQGVTQLLGLAGCHWQPARGRLAWLLAQCLVRLWLLKRSRVDSLPTVLFTVLQGGHGLGAGVNQAPPKSLRDYYTVRCRNPDKHLLCPQHLPNHYLSLYPLSSLGRCQASLGELPRRIFLSSAPWSSSPTHEF